MTVTKQKYLFQTTLLTLFSGVAGGWVYYSINPYHYIGGYPLIPVFFYAFGVFMINMTETCRKQMPGRMLLIYLLIRLIKMFASIILMLVYCIIVHEESKGFLLAFIANYLIYLIYDSWFFFNFEADRKWRMKKENETIV